VLADQPDHPAALELRGLIAADQGDYPSAIRDFRRLVAANGDDAQLVGQLGLLYLAAKQPREAIRRFTRALEIDEKQFLSRRGRSDAEIAIGEHTAALTDLEKAHAAQPDNTGVLNNLAWLLATSPEDSIRDGRRAIELAKKACELTEWKEPHIVSTLAAAYAEAGDFEQARTYSGKAVESAENAPEIRAQLQQELESYKAEKPWREKQQQEEADLRAKNEDAANPVAVDGDANGDAKQESGEDEPGDAKRFEKPPAEAPTPRTPRRPFQ
jgi:tetratricopeptide (TPR) repeat protein